MISYKPKRIKVLCTSLHNISSAEDGCKYDIRSENQLIKSTIWKKAQNAQEAVEHLPNFVVGAADPLLPPAAVDTAPSEAPETPETPRGEGGEGWLA